MGLLLQATCSCGYKSGEIFAGGGFDPTRHYLPGRCEHCREITTVEMSKSRLRCPLCRRKPSEIYDVFASGDPLDATMPPVRYECLKCGKPTLVFEFAGLWD